eukprot:Skav212090  [mRNA]  locus=scaffold4509:37891:38649:+ [translate_table: standard]
MLRRQEKLRFAPETLERMEARTASGGEWLDVVRDMQREVALDNGFRSAVGIETAVRRMQTAHTTVPEFVKLSVYARANLAEVGTLQPGQAFPNVPLVGLDGNESMLTDWCGDLTVVRFHQKQVRFLCVYIREAHATDVWPIDGPKVWEPQSTSQRVQTARQFQRSCHLSWPMAVDGIEDAFLHHFAPWPFRFYVFRGNLLEFKSAPVDGRHRIDEIEEALRAFEQELKA